MTHNGGQLQVNVNFPAPYNEFAFLNAVKSSTTTFFTSGGTPGTDWAALLTSSGYPSAMPSGGAIWRKYVYIYGAVNDTWDFFYPAAHTLRVLALSGGTITEATIGSGHKRYTIASVATAGAPFLCAVDIQAMSGSDWTGGISLYKTAHQADFTDDADGFDPLFLARYGFGSGKTPFGMIRFMNWGGGFGLQKLYSHRHLVSDASWLSELIDARYFAGTASKTLNHYTTATRLPGNPAVWTDGQMVQFWMATRPSVLSITATTMGATTSFACTGHGLTTGEEVELQRGSRPTGQLLTAMDGKSTVTGLPLKWSVTVTDANNFTIPINSTGFSAVGAFELFPVITVGDGTLARKRCVSPDMQGQYDSSYAVLASGGVIMGIYQSQIDAIVMRGIESSVNPGVPLEIQAKLCNKLKCHWWLCVPTYMQGAEEQAYLTSARALLDSELLLVIEKANEIWNSSFNAYHYGVTLAAVRGSGTINPETGHGILFNDLADNAATALGASATNYRLVMSLYSASNYAAFVNTTQCSFLSSGNSALYPANKADVIAIASYCGTNFAHPSWISANYPGWLTCLQNWQAGNKSTAFDWFTSEMLSASSTILGNSYPLDRHVNAGLTGVTDAWIAGKSAFTGRFGAGIQIWNYEGMEHNLGADWMDGGFPTGGISVADIDTFYREYKRSSQYGWLSGRILANLKDAGIVWPSVFTVAGAWSSGAMWGQWPTNDLYEVAPPGWETIYNLNKGVRRFKLQA